MLKLTLSKRKPLKITAKAPSREPYPFQTTVKTVYDLKKEKGDQTERGTINIAQTGLGQFRREEAPPTGGREPLQEDENGKLNRPQGGQGGLDDKGSKRNGNGNGKPHANGGPGSNGDPNRGGHPGENGEPPRRGGGEPPRRNGELGGGDGDQTPVMMMGVGMGPPLPHQILHHLEEGSIGGPDLFMWYRDLQDHQVRWDSLVKLVEMEEMGKPHR